MAWGAAPLCLVGTADPRFLPFMATVYGVRHESVHFVKELGGVDEKSRRRLVFLFPSLGAEMREAALPRLYARGEGATLRQGQGACGWAEFHTVCDCGRGRGHSLPRLSGSLRFPGAFQRCHDFARCTCSSFRGGYAHLPCMLCCLSLP